MLVPGLSYPLETFVESLSSKGISDMIKVGCSLVFGGKWDPGEDSRMRVGRTLGLWAAWDMSAQQRLPAFPSCDRQAGSLSFEPAQTEDLVLAKRRGQGVCPLHHVFSVGAGAPRRPECTPAECPHQHACE